MTTIVPGSPEHDAAMIALAEKNGVRIRVSNSQSGESELIPVGTQSTPEEKPAATPEQSAELIGGKFKSQADLLAAYQELERKQSQAAKPAVADPTKPAEKPAEEQKAEGEKAEQKPEEKAEGAAPTVAEVRAKATEELTKDGKLSDATYANAEKLGWDRETVDAYVEGQKAQLELAKMRAEVLTTKVHAEVGGADKFAALNQWAAANWTAEQITAHNEAVTSGDAAKVLSAVKALQSAHVAANGTASKRVEPQASSSGTPSVDMFRSKDEAMKAFNDPRYTKGDRAFHAEFDRKLEAAIKAGIDVGF